MTTLAGNIATAAEPRRGHALFRQFPLDGQVLLSTGPAPTPYHVYDGRGLFIGGSADLAAAQALLAHEQVSVVQTEAGRALMAVWVCDFSDASLGPHHELQFSVFVSERRLPPVTAHPLGLIELMLTRPDIRMLCHGLWNSTPPVVAYNRELLALDARLSDSVIECDGGAIGFAVNDQATTTPVLEGRLHRVDRPALGAGLSLVGRLGLGRLMRLARAPWIGIQVVNPVGERLARNAVADSFTKTDRSVLRRFDPRLDRLHFGDERYRQLRFEPQFFQSMEGFRFVYRAPR